MNGSYTETFTGSDSGRKRGKYTRINSQDEEISYGFKPHNFPFKGPDVRWYKEENKNH